jgi:hypothetical protein
MHIMISPSSTFLSIRLFSLFLKRKRLSLIHTHIYFMLLSKRLSLSAGFRIVCAEDGHNLGIRRKEVGNSLQAMFDPDQ